MRLMRVMARQPLFLSLALQVACMVKILLQLTVLFVTEVPGTVLQFIENVQLVWEIIYGSGSFCIAL